MILPHMRSARPQHHEPGRGFTLIEVLVVVAIIALLVAILLPSLNRARFQARLVACKANMHDLGTAFHMYGDMYRDYFPLTAGAGEDSFYCLWKARLLRNTNILIDPATRNIIRPETLTWPEDFRTSAEGVQVPYHRGPGGEVGDISRNARQRDDARGGHSYEYNGCYDDTSKNPAWSGKHKKRTHYRFFLSQIVLLHDSDESLFDEMGTAAYVGCNPSKQNNGNNCPQPWDNHGKEGMNVMFADGHAEYLKKIAGTWNDVTANDPGDFSSYPKFSENAVIDQVMARSQYPWNYFRK